MPILAASLAVEKKMAVKDGPREQVGTKYFRRRIPSIMIDEWKTMLPHISRTSIERVSA